MTDNTFLFDINIKVKSLIKNLTQIILTQTLPNEDYF